MNQAVLDVTSTKFGRRKRLEDTAFTDLFDFATVDDSTMDAATPARLGPSDTNFPEHLTGRVILEKRLALQYTKNEFSRLVGVSTTCIALWEANGDKTIRPNALSLKKLRAIW